MTSSTANKAELLWPGIQAIWGDTYSEYEPLYTQFFQVQKSDKAFEKQQGVSGLPLAAVKDEGDEITFQDFFQGFQQEYRNITYALGTSVTFELMEDDQYNVINKIPAYLARSMRQTQETVAHNVLNNAFSGTGGADGVSLIATNHPYVGISGTQSNRPSIASDLTQTSLEQAIIDIMDFKDGQGLKTRVTAVKLIVPTELGIVARKILNTQYEVGSANNDVNVISGSMGLCVTPYLTDPNAWFVTTDVDNGLVYMERMPARIDRRNAERNLDLEFMTVARWSVGFTDWRGVYGSPGAS